MNPYGSEFLREIRKNRTYYKKGFITQKTKDRIREGALQHARSEENWGLAELWKAIPRDWEE